MAARVGAQSAIPMVARRGVSGQFGRARCGLGHFMQSVLAYCVGQACPIVVGIWPEQHRTGFEPWTIHPHIFRPMAWQMEETVAASPSAWTRLSLGSPDARGMLCFQLCPERPGARLGAKDILYPGLPKRRGHCRRC